MSSPSPSMAPDNGSPQTVLIVVAIIAGALFILVLSLGLIVVYLYFRKDRIAEKKSSEVNNRHRLFREPTIVNSKFDDLVDLEGIEQSSFFRDGSKRASKKKSKKMEEVVEEATRKNPTFGKEDLYGDALDLNNRNRKPIPAKSSENQNGIDNPSMDISDESGATPTGDGNAIPPGSPQSSGGAKTPATPGSPDLSGSSKLDILNEHTWKKVEEGEEIEPTGDEAMPSDEIPTSNVDSPASDGDLPARDEVNTTESEESPQRDTAEDEFTSASDHQSRTDNDVINDVMDDIPEDTEINDDDTYYMYSPFQRSDSQRRRSFQTRNSAVIDFYEGGDLTGRGHSIDTVSPAASQPKRENFWDGFSAPSNDKSAQGRLWQSKRIF